MQVMLRNKKKRKSTFLWTIIYVYIYKVLKVLLFIANCSCMDLRKKIAYNLY